MDLSIRVFFLSVTSSNTVNTGQLRSTEVNLSQLRYIHPSVSRSVSWLVGRSVGWLVSWSVGWLVGWLVGQSVSLHYGIDEAAEKKPLIVGSIRYNDLDKT